MEKKIQIRTPRAPHPASLATPELQIMDSSGTRVICWCPVHECGAIYHIEARIWSMEMPIKFSEFLEGLRARNLVVPDTEDLQRWIARCTADGPQPTAPGGTC